MKWLKKYGPLTLLVLLGIFFCIWLIFTTVDLWRDQQLASAYVAIGTLTLAAATGILAFLSWRSIKGGYDKENRERRDRLLNEIIEWAIDLSKCLVKDDADYVRDYMIKHVNEYPQLAKLKDIDPLRAGYKMDIAEHNELIFKLSIVASKNYYISKITSIFSSDLKNKVTALITDLELLIKLHRSNLENKKKIPEYPGFYMVSIAHVEEISKHLPNVRAAIEKVIEEAAKLKTKDIS